MVEEPDANQILSLARELLNSGTIGSSLVVPSVQLEEPISVQDPNGILHSWFVAVTLDRYLTGFFQFLRDGTFMRFSSFQRKAGDLTQCPASGDWLDPDLIKKRSEALLEPDETSGKPFLTFDRTPDRLVWAVPMKNANKKIRLVYVVGETVYLRPAGDTYD